MDQDRERVQAALDLPSAYDLLRSLHTAAADNRYRPINDHGDRYRSMVEPVEADDALDAAADAATPRAGKVGPVRVADEPIPGQTALF